MFDILMEPGTGEWSIVHRLPNGEAETLLRKRDVHAPDAAEVARVALRRAYNKGRRDEAAIRVAALNGLFNPAPLTRG